MVPSLIHGLHKAQQGTEACLSSRETQVLELVAGGHSNKQIAEYLEITDQTVKNHITSILRKLNVNDRTHAVTIALRKGWITNPVPAEWSALS